MLEGGDPGEAWPGAAAQLALNRERPSDIYRRDRWVCVGCATQTYGASSIPAGL